MFLKEMTKEEKFSSFRLNIRGTEKNQDFSEIKRISDHGLDESIQTWIIN